jgi:hypothetical protein
MKSLRGITPLALAGLLVLQASCGDSSGPGNAAASVDANSSTTLTGSPGAPVDEPPSVIVHDASGNPVAGVRVTFAVTAGGGSVTGDHPTSDASGVATVGSWTLGSSSATNTLVASANGHSVVFTANGSNPCDNFPVHAFGSTTNGQLSEADCSFGDGSFVDFYTVTIPSAGTYIFDQSSSAFDSYLLLFSAGAQRIAENDNTGTTPNSRIKAILPAGDFVIAANSLRASVTGAYALTTSASSAEITNCEDVFVGSGTTTSQSLSSTDCTANGIFSDDFIVFLQSGQSITVSMTSSAINSYLELTADGSSTILASNDNIDGTTQNARLAFTAASTGYYFVKARSAAAGSTGAYTLAVQ